jgi:hypothetical protein
LRTYKPPQTTNELYLTLVRMKTWAAWSWPLFERIEKMRNKAMEEKRFGREFSRLTVCTLGHFESRLKRGAIAPIWELVPYGPVRGT